MVFHPYPVKQHLVAHLKTYRKLSQPGTNECVRLRLMGDTLASPDG